MTVPRNEPSQPNNASTKLALDPNIFLAEQDARNADPYVIRFHQERLVGAIQVIKDALKQFRLEQLAIAFNGGKDCTALLDLVVRTINEATTSGSTKNGLTQHQRKCHLLIVYFRSRPQFPALEEFIREKCTELSGELVVYDGDLKTALGTFKHDYPLVKAIFMGTRCKDPSSKHLAAFSPTDSSWPQFIRILPILNFSYHDVWLYLKEFSVAYCRIYDEGYTSIGWEGNTFKNPKLKNTTKDGSVTYKPAFLLEDSDDERTSRE